MLIESTFDTMYFMFKLTTLFYVNMYHIRTSFIAEFPHCLVDRCLLDPDVTKRLLLI